MRSFLMFVALVLAPLSAAQAQQTVTTRDIIELSKAGLPEEVLLALIDVHRPVFPVDTVTLKGLKDAGVAPNVIVAMIKSGRELPVAHRSCRKQPPAQASAPPPEVVYVEPERRDEPAPRVYYEDRVREVAVPVYIPVPGSARDRSSAPSTGPRNRFTGVGRQASS